MRLTIKYRRGLTLLILLSPFMLTGCSESSTHGTVRGTVTFDDAPIAEGTVRFVPVESGSQTASAMVSEGEFTATVPVGRTRVEFSAPKVVGQQAMYDTPDSPKVDVVAELLPPRYNVQSELTLDVQPGSQHAPFRLHQQ